MLTAFLRRLDAYVRLSDDDRQALSDLPTRQRVYEPAMVIAREDERLEKVFWIEEGWACRYRRLRNGERQIVNFILPGEFFDLQGLVSTRSDHTVSALSQVKLFEARAEDFTEAAGERPAIFNALLWASVVEEAILREHIVQLGRQPAVTRIAFLILELYRRQLLTTGTHDHELDFPVSHAVIADALGLSRVHVSRSLKTLRDKGCIALAERHIKILHLEELETIAEYEDRYLHIQPVAAQTSGAILPR
ncbi:MAG: Crp/Fnr family transcriptional regulator [Oceanicaulis sp.]